MSSIPSTAVCRDRFSIESNSSRNPDPDNSPPGAGTAYSCGYGRGYTAGGKGTYADPLTFATAPGEFNKCEIIYDEYTRKYLVFQDTCAKCIKDWAKGIYHIDIWTGSATVNGGKAQIQCEDALTPNQGQPVVRNDTTSTAFSESLPQVTNLASTC